MVFITKNKSNWGIVLIIIVLTIIMMEIIGWYVDQKTGEESLMEEPFKKNAQTSEVQKSKVTSFKDFHINRVTNFEECLAKKGTLSLKNYPCQCEYKGKVFVKETGVQNVEELFQKYIDEEFGFSFYYPKDSKIKTSNNEIFLESGEIAIRKVEIKDGDYLFSFYKPAGGPDLLWTSYIFYDKNREECVNYVNEYDHGIYMGDWYKVIEREKSNPQATKMPPPEHVLREADFYTVSGLPVFNQIVRFGHYNVVCLSPNRFLEIEANLTLTSNDILDTLTKTVVRTDQKIDDKEFKPILIENTCLSVKWETMRSPTYWQAVEDYGF